MNASAQQSPAATGFENVAQTAERRRILSLSVTAVLLIDAGLVLMALDQENAATKFTALFVHAGNPPVAASKSNIQARLH